MKKILPVVFMLGACTYSGTMYIPTESQTATVGKDGVFVLEKKGVAFYNEHLPSGKYCKKIGIVKDTHKPNAFFVNKYLAISNQATKVGANTAVLTDKDDQGRETMHTLYDCR